MASNWYYRQNGRIYGPVSAQELREFVKSGHIAFTDSISRDRGNWVSARFVPDEPPRIPVPEIQPVVQPRPLPPPVFRVRRSVVVASAVMVACGLAALIYLNWDSISGKTPEPYVVVSRAKDKDPAPQSIVPPVRRSKPVARTGPTTGPSSTPQLRIIPFTDINPNPTPLQNLMEKKAPAPVLPAVDSPASAPSTVDAPTSAPRSPILPKDDSLNKVPTAPTQIGAPPAPVQDVTQSP